MADQGVSALVARVMHLAQSYRDYPADRTAISTFPAGNPVFVTGPVRSGTTWFAAMLSVPGVWHMHEPHNPNHGIMPRSYTYARPGEQNPFAESVMERISRGGLRQALRMRNVESILSPLRLFPPPRGFRLLLKDPNACLLAAFLAQRYPFKTYVLFRHPVAQASSVVRLKWPVSFFLREFLDDRPLIEDHLAPWESLIRRHATEDSLEAATVLVGCLSRVLHNGFATSSAARCLMFEELCRDPLGEFEAIFRELGFPYDADTRRYHESLTSQASGNSTYRTHDVRRLSVDMISAWRSTVSDHDLSRLRKTWDAFEVPFYTENSWW